MELLTAINYIDNPIHEEPLPVPVIDPITGKVVPDCFIKVHRFLQAGTGTRRTGECKENREWVAYLAHKGSTDWPYRGIPLSTVMSYLKWRGRPLL